MERGCLVIDNGDDFRMDERVPLVIEPNPLNKRYLNTKRVKLGHLLDETDA